MRKVTVKTRGVLYRSVMRVVALEHLIEQWKPELDFLVRVSDNEALNTLEQLSQAGLNNLVPLLPASLAASDWPTIVVETGEQLHEGDVVAVADHINHAHVLYRVTDQHHTVFLTNRCNSYCLMCSQPPTRHDDSWLIQEALQVSAHLPHAPGVLGFSGGEPLLLDDDLRIILDTYIAAHPDTRYELLSNGRLLADSQFAERLLKGLGQQVTWMVPLYGHADFLHDFVVQSPGAFEQTLSGLLNLRRFKQSIQLRIVLIRPVLENLPSLCEFIGRNLPFVREVALMACEPTGFALAHPELTDVDLREWSTELNQGVRTLQRAGVPAILMNTPLCALAENLWPLAHKSISDWKRSFAPQCTTCAVKDDCSGLFSWHRPDRHSMKIQTIEGILNV